MKFKLTTTAMVLSVLAFFLVTILLVSPKALAAERKGVQISPLTFDFKVEDSKTQSGTVTVTNLNDEPLNYVIEVENFADVNEQGAPSFAGKEAEGAVTTLADWFTFDAPKEGILEPKKSVAIGFAIDIPVGADPGGHYVAVFAREVKKNAEGKTELGVASRVGSLVLVTVPGAVTKGASVSDLVFPKFIWKGPADFSLKVKNTGTVHYDSTASVDLKPLLGSNVNIGLGTHTLIPKTTSPRDYKGTWNKKYPFGYYKVTARALDGNGQEVTVNGGVIIAIPLIIVIPVIIGLVLIILIIKYLRKHLRFRS